MAIPDYQSLMLPALELASKGETSVPAAKTEVATRFDLSDDELASKIPQRVILIGGKRLTELLALIRLKSESSILENQAAGRDVR